MKRWYEFRAQAKGAEIVIYDEIGAFGIPAKAFLDELKALGPVAELTVRINSPGGSVFDGVAIYNALKRHDAAITVWIDGIAASIASMISMAGDEVVMPENAMLMLHDPSGLVLGTAADMRAMAEALDKMKAGMVGAYRDKSGRDDAEIEALMRDETWLSAQEAVDLGLADRVEQPVRMAAHFDLSRFRNPPPQLAAILTSPTPQEDLMSDPQKTRPRKPDAVEATAAGAAATGASTEQLTAAEGNRPAESAEPAPAPAAARKDQDSAPILAVENLTKHFPLRRATPFGRRRFVHAVDGVGFAVGRGETVGLVGESGCGKSTIARLITRLHEPSAGVVRFEGRDISHASRAEIRPLRRRMQMIFQDPYASLNPRMTVGEILAEPLTFHGLTSNPRATRERVQELLALVGLNPRAVDSYPHEFSGGQRQRIGTARALAVEPALIVADEPISSLDVNIQAQVINLFVDLQERFDLTFLFIAHDLAVVRHISDRIVVLYLGKVMEVASSAALFEAPLHPYTVSLISAVPIPEVDAERARARIRLTGEPPSAIDPPSGCRFRTRCPIARAQCAESAPPLVEERPGHWAACHFAGQLG